LQDQHTPDGVIDVVDDGVGADKEMEKFFTVGIKIDVGRLGKWAGCQSGNLAFEATARRGFD